MFWFHKSKFSIPKAPGWNEDKADERDYMTEEILGSPKAVSWPEKTSFRTFPIGYQDRSSSCVGWTISKLFGVESFNDNGFFRQFSARDIYSQRSNQSKGMYIREAMQLGVDKGITLEHLLPSYGLEEGAMNNRKDVYLDTEQVAKIYKGKSYLSISSDFESIASIIQNSGEALAIGVIGSNEGWISTDGFVRVPKLGEKTWGHALPVLDFGMYKGKKVLVGDNSWGPDWGNKGQFFLTEEYRPFMFPIARYFIGLPDDWRETEEKEIAKPKYQFLKDLYYGLQGNQEVGKLQDCLKYLGMFPLKISSTGNYFGITKEAVETFQTVNKIVKVGESGYGRSGPFTRATLNKIFK